MIQTLPVSRFSHKSGAMKNNKKHKLTKNIPCTVVSCGTVRLLIRQWHLMQIHFVLSKIITEVVCFLCSGFPKLSSDRKSLLSLYLSLLVSPSLQVLSAADWCWLWLSIARRSYISSSSAQTTSSHALRFTLPFIRSGWKAMQGLLRLAGLLANY